MDMSKWNISIPSAMEELPSLYWLPKLHTYPYGSRVIAASNKCPTKPLLFTSTLYVNSIGRLTRHATAHYTNMKVEGIRCSSYEDFKVRNMLITTRLNTQGFSYNKLVKSFKKLYVKCIHLMTNTMFFSRVTFLMVYVGYMLVILSCTNESQHDDYGCETCVALYIPLAGGSLYIMLTPFSLLPFVFFKLWCSVSGSPLLRCIYIWYVLLLWQHYYEISLGVWVEFTGGKRSL